MLVNAHSIVWSSLDKNNFSLYGMGKEWGGSPPFDGYNPILWWIYFFLLHINRILNLNYIPKEDVYQLMNEKQLIEG